MANIQKCQALTRIGAMKVQGMRGFKKPRTLGEVFELDLDVPDERAAYYRLFRLGAIKPVGQPSRGSASVAETVTAEPVEPVDPVVDITEPLTDPGEVMTDIAEPVETEPEPELEPASEIDQLDVEAIGPDTSLTYIYEFHRSEIDFLTEEQIDTLRRIGIERIADIPSRTDQEISSVQGVGKGKVRRLRELYESYGG